MQNPLNIVDRFLNSITMYRLLVWGLMAVGAYAVALAFAGVLPFGGMGYLYSLVLLLLSTWLTNLVCAKVWQVPANVESWTISALILFFLMFPAVTLADAGVTLLVGVLAMASKYLINYKGRHIFNPVAIGAVAIGLLGSGNVFWWVATPAMFVPVLVLGLLIVRKVRKFQMFGIYIVLAVAVHMLNGATFAEALISYPVIFFAAIMLTEPLTMPGRKRDQNIYAGIAALLPFSPEMALATANALSFAFGFKGRLRLVLKSKHEVAKDVWEFSFAYAESMKDKMKKAYLPGQFFDWTIADPSPDLRGNRRYFTIASSPTESTIKLGVKMAPEGKGSSFKKALLDMKEGQQVFAGSLGGDFVLPKDTKKKLVFIAGGIGVTPFRSMIKYLIDTKEKRDVVLFYTVKDESEIAYRDIFEEAEREIGIRTVFVPTSTKGFINEDMILKEVVDYPERMFYLSGPNAMVESYKKLLKGMGVKSKSFKTDYFPGF